MAWAVVPTTVGDVTVNEIHTVLCLEDGRVVAAPLSDIRFDYRYNLANGRWVDVSRVPAEGDDANADQEDADDGGPEVPG